VNPVTLAEKVAAPFAARAVGHDRDASFPADDIADLRAAGLLGLMAPADLGGLGASFATYAEVARAIARQSPATALVFNMHASVTGALAEIPEDLARALGADDDFFVTRTELLAGSVRGALYLVAMSEHGAGSRFSAMSTTYEPEGDGWRIRGRKTFCSGAGHADAYLVVARARTGDSISQFLVPASCGLVVEQTWDPLGMRATASNDLVIDVHVEHGALLGGVEGLAPLLARTMPHWLVVSYAAVYVGVAEAALDAACDDLVRRGLHRLPAVRARVGRADATASAAWLATCEAARCVDEEPGAVTTNRAVHRAKLLAGDAAMAVASSMVEACGASATRRGTPLERLFRDARCGALQPATSDVCADWLGVAALGGDPDDAELARW
jgi:alkylation response protein AidB-like acyl-CoA dehydrogenase